MRIRSRTLLSVMALSFSLLGAVATDVGIAPPANAQFKDGEYGLFQRSTLVGWVYASADHTKEFWAYIDSEFDFAVPANTQSNPWKLEGQCIGSGPYSCYAAWKTSVLQRAAAQGKNLTFENHSVTQEQISN